MDTGIERPTNNELATYLVEKYNLTDLPNIRCSDFWNELTMWPNWFEILTIIVKS